MSIFSKIRGAKKAANEHKTKVQESDTVADQPAPYRHVPTHAAVDALSGAPSSWKAEDRTQIKAQYQRRSAMIRNNSSLSTVGNMKRSSSYTGSSWNDRGDEVLEFRHELNKYSDSTVMNNLHKSTNRKVGEAPLLDRPPTLPLPVHGKENTDPEASVDVEEHEGQKKRRRIFGRKNA
ncbi:MAG: hypothetical protein M1819_004543 [Sarea resinae]|nr:MAG: hypothetical protein M1819_004543 [Sarea resinae]